MKADLHTRSALGMQNLLAILVISLGTCPMSWALEQPAADKAAEAPPTAEVVAAPLKTESGKNINILAEGLNNPTGIAIQPETGAVFVADSGNGQVVRIVDGKIEPIITDFPKESLGLTPNVTIGPLSLAFLTRDSLVVGCGGQSAGEDSLRVYSLANPPVAVKAESSQAAHALAASADPAQSAEGNFFSLALNADALIATSQGDVNKGWINIAGRPSPDSLGQLTRHIAAAESLATAVPSALTITPHGYVLVANLGQLTTDKDSVAGFFEIASKKQLMKLELGLYDVCGLAYSPRRQLYALDLSWSQPDQGGLYRIIDDKSSATGLRTKLIAKLPHATAMCFDSDGGLLVTILGPVNAEGNSQGRLVLIPSEENL